LGELATVLTARLDEVTRALTVRLDALAASVDAVANAPAPPPPPAPPPVDLSGLIEVQRSVDGLAAHIEVLAARPSFDPAPFEDVERTLDGLCARVDALALAPAPVLDPSALEGVQLSLDRVATRVSALVSSPPAVPEVDLSALDRMQDAIAALAEEVRTAAAARPPLPAPAPSEDTGRLLAATAELAAQVAAMQEELTQLKRRVGVRAKVPVVLDDAQMDDIARRVAGVVTAELVQSFEVTD
jgi:hypothetical protein